MFTSSRSGVNILPRFSPNGFKWSQNNLRITALVWYSISYLYLRVDAENDAESLASMHIFSPPREGVVQQY